MTHLDQTHTSMTVEPYDRTVCDVMQASFAPDQIRANPLQVDL